MQFMFTGMYTVFGFFVTTYSGLCKYTEGEKITLGSYLENFK